MTGSLPLSKKDHFTETSVESDNWVHISNLSREVLEKKYRQRTGAFTKPPHPTTGPAPVKVIKGFTIDIPVVSEALEEKEEEDEEDGCEGSNGCTDCTYLKNQLNVCTELNELLLKKFSRIIQLLDKGMKMIEELREGVGLKDMETRTNPMFVPSQNVCIVNEADKEERRQSGLEYLSIEMTKHMFPTVNHSMSVSELDRLSSSLHKYLEECRAMSLSSANLCFDSRFGVKAQSPDVSPSNRTLKRMHTLSGTSNITSSIEQSLEIGSLGSATASRGLSVPYWHSEQRHNEKSTTLRRTHSENELLNLTTESRVFLMDSELMEKKEREASASHGYSRIFSTPGDSDNQRSHDPVSHGLPFRSHLMSVLRYQPSVGSAHEGESEPVPGGAAHEVLADDCAKPLVVGLSGEESTQLMDKVTTLEQHRLTLLKEIESMKEKNNRLWETVQDLREEVDEKEFQLKILTADVQLATMKINGANRQAMEADSLKHENQHLWIRLGNLEDESKAVKESLVQLVTEKAATNKALTIENQRLRQKVKRLPSQSSHASFDLDQMDADVLSCDDEFRMQGLIAELDSSEYVHKQGFLVKQGNKRKTWKRRMFVLDTHAISYYKTEEALGSVPLEEITRVQVSQSTYKKNLFEIHRNDPTQKGERIYYLSAPSHDEMQSWIGIIQTLKDTKRQSLRQSTFMDIENSPVGSPTDKTVLTKQRCMTSTGQGSLTLPPQIDKNARQRKTMIEGSAGVRNRMFTDTGQRRTDIVIPINSSDEEDPLDTATSRSPFSASSDEEHHTGQDTTGNFRSKHQNNNNSSDSKK